MKEQSTARGFAVLSIAGLAVKILSLLYVPFLIRIIDNEGYGIYGITYQIFLFAYVITNSGIPVAISKIISELIALNNYRDAVKAFKIARFILFVLGLTMALLMLAIAHPLAVATNNERAYLALLALSPTLLITAVMSSYRGYFQGRGNMTPTAVSQIGEQAINIVFSLVFAAIFMKYGVKEGVAGATIGTTLGALFACAYLIYVYRKNRKFKIPKGIEQESVTRLPNKVLLRRIISYGLPITICTGFQNAGNLIDAFNINSRLFEAGFVEKVVNIKYGFLVLYTTLINVPITLISALCVALLPAISGAAALNDRKQIGNKVSFALKICFMISIPSAVGLAVLSKPIFILFSKGMDGHELLKYGSLVIVFMSIVQIQTTILQSVGKLYTVTAVMICGILIKIISNYILVSKPEININGAVYGNILCFLIPLLINAWVVRKSLKIKVRLIKRAFKPIISSVLMGGTVYFIYFAFEALLIKDTLNKLSIGVATAVSVIVGVMVYGFSLILLGGITKKDLDSLSPKITKLIPAFVKERMR